MLAAFLPLWTITFLGWVAARFGWFEPVAQKALTSFAFHLAIPAVIFTTLAKLPVHQLPLVPLTAFAVSTVVIFALAYLISRFVVKGERRERVVAAMASSYVNSGNLGIPVGFYVLHDVSLVVAVVAFQTVIVTPFIVGALDLSSNGWRRIAFLPLRVPVVSASLLGTLVTVTGLSLPGVVLRPLEILAGAAAPLALFALGMSLRPATGTAPRKRFTLRIGPFAHTPTPADAPSPTPPVPVAPAASPPPSVAVSGTSLSSSSPPPVSSPPPPPVSSPPPSSVSSPPPPPVSSPPPSSVSSPPPSSVSSPPPSSVSSPASASLEAADGAELQPSLRRPELGMVTVAKLVLQPLVAYAAARWLFDLRGVELIAVTVFAGLPTAQNTFVYATQYNVRNGLSRDAVLVTSVLSLLSLSVILWLLST